MSERKVIRVSEDSEKVVREYAEAKGVNVGEAADLLIATAQSRLDALKRYAENKKPMAPGKPKKKEKKPAPRAVVEKAAKAARDGKAKKAAAKKAPKSKPPVVEEHAPLDDEDDDMLPAPAPN